MRLVVLALALAASSVWGQEPPPGPAPLRLQLRLDGWLGGAQGDLQTPKGGQPGTTSSERPTVREVGLGGLTVIPRLEASLTLLGDHELHLSYALAFWRGAARLEQPLVSQAQAFDAGDPVRSGLDLQMIQLGYRPRWLTLEVGGWTLVPEVGVALTNLRYTLDGRGPGAGHVARTYSFGSPYLGLLVRRPLVPGLDLELELGGSALVNGVTLLEAEARLVWTPWVVDDVAIGLELGLRGAWVRREDGQPLQQNDPDVRLGAFSTDPWGGVVVGVRFEF